MCTRRVISVVLLSAAALTGCGELKTAKVVPAATVVASAPAAAKASASSACKSAHTKTKKVKVTPNRTYDGYFKTQAGPGWIAGDAGYTTVLPDGRRVWVFSDTMIGSTVGKKPFFSAGIPHNSMLVGKGSALESLYGGTFAKPTSLIPDQVLPDGRKAWWYVSATYVEGSQLLVFVNQMTKSDNKLFAAPTGVAAIAVFSLPVKATDVPRFQRLVQIADDPAMQWGNGFIQDGGYDYVYGVYTVSKFDPRYGKVMPYHHTKVARVPQGHSTVASSWRFWSGSDWVAGESHATVVNSTLAEAVSPQPASWGSGYIAISVSPFPGNDLRVQFACSLQGPWSAPKKVYDIPEVRAGRHIVAYIPSVVSVGSGNIVVSYDVNTTDGPKGLVRNINQYRQRFVTITTK